MQIQAVAVVEMSGETFLGMVAFDDTDEGNREAEAAFAARAKDNGFSDEEIHEGIHEGVLEDGNGYKIAIIHAD